MKAQTYDASKLAMMAELGIIVAGAQWWTYGGNHIQITVDVFQLALLLDLRVILRVFLLKILND